MGAVNGVPPSVYIIIITFIKKNSAQRNIQTLLYTFIIYWRLGGKPNEIKNILFFCYVFLFYSVPFISSSYLSILYMIIFFFTAHQSLDCITLFIQNYSAYLPPLRPHVGRPPPPPGPRFEPGPGVSNYLTDMSYTSILCS